MADRISPWPLRRDILAKPSSAPPPKLVSNDCDTAAGYKLSFAPSEKPQTPERHFVKVYEAHNRTDKQPPVFTLTIDRPGPVYLELESYEPVDWKIKTGSKTQIVAVYAHGYHAQSVAIDRNQADAAIYLDSTEKRRQRLGPERPMPNVLEHTSGAYCYSMRELTIR